MKLFGWESGKKGALGCLVGKFGKRKGLNILGFFWVRKALFKRTGKGL